MDTVKTVVLIETTLARRGNGKGPDSPVRVITQYWIPDGELLIEYDPSAIELTPEMRAKMREALYQKLGENIKSMEVWEAMLSALC